MMFKTECALCGRTIVINTPKKMRDTKGFTCNACVHRNSAVRDGINESPYVKVVRFRDILLRKKIFKA